MNKEAVDKMFKNIDKLREKIKRIKKIEDYGINCTTIRESIIYPEIAAMRQDIWLSKKDKIQVNYINKEDNFEIILKFKENSIIQALDVITIYLSHWNDEIYTENVKIHIGDKQLPILEYNQLCLKLNKEGLQLKEDNENDTYDIINEGVWINIEETIKTIKSLEKIQEMSIKIKKIEGEDNFWEYMSCIHISFNSKYYEDGYLENLEWKRVDPLLMEWRSNNKQ